MSEHDTLRELAGPYALDILDADERRAFERHLPLCDECQRAVADARAVEEHRASRQKVRARENISRTSGSKCSSGNVS